MRIFVVEGPNLNLLGIREPELYGSETLDELHRWLENETYPEPCEFRFFQSNSEGALIDAIHENRTWAQGILINPAAYTHTSFALRDALSAVALPAVEVHLTDIKRREAFRAVSVIAPVCLAQRMGKGKISYRDGINRLLKAL
ncbi:MAG: type II 3-dehydroquinate dehydratase [Fidelibacterota bacterium]